MIKLSDLLSEIEKKTQITNRWEDPNYLADLLLELGSYYASLGTHVAEAEQGANLAEAHCKVVRERVKLQHVEMGDSATVADSRARVETEQEEQDYISLRYKARLIAVARDGLGRTIDVIRSKLSMVKKEMEQ